MPQEPRYIDSGGRRIAEDIGLAKDATGLVGDVAGLGYGLARQGVNAATRGVLRFPQTISRGAKNAYRATASGVRQLPQTMGNLGRGAIELGMVPFRAIGQGMETALGQEGANNAQLLGLEAMTQHPMLRGLTADMRNPMPAGQSDDDEAASMHQKKLYKYINDMVAGNRFDKDSLDQLDRHLNYAKAFGFNPKLINDLEDYVVSKGRMGSLKSVTGKYDSREVGNYRTGEGYKFIPGTWRTGTSRPVRNTEAGYVPPRVGQDKLEVNPGDGSIVIDPNTNRPRRIQPSNAQVASTQGTTVAPFNPVDTVLGALPLMKIAGMTGDAGLASKNKYIRGTANVLTAAPVRKAVGGLVQSVKKSALKPFKKPPVVRF